ncbi:MAG: 23S rRNA (guanosine(2251)-2'-O)-methyltransferase RlmB [Flavobacteriales bacterium]|nr:23S rRNA (guanosine(2251)-2'-O)-methyltransferase RlmB [Flavobacteriales bacterium]|tara:strand:+ start:20929 stop:21672 length:744 start_codon:yes stop_codon:yes gene_type:complete
MKITRYENAIFGLRPIIEAIQAGKEIDTLFIQKGLKNELFQELWQLVRARKVNYKHVPVEKLNRLTRKNHQGVFAFISPINFHKTDNIIQNVFEKGENPLFLVLDRVTDVRNFGAIVRTAECSGVQAIIVPEKGSAAINGDALKTSAGALHNIPICREFNLKATIEYLKNCGLQIIGCTEKTEEKIYQLNFNLPTAIIMGSEEDGISTEYLKLCDYKAKIPMNGTIGSLNVSVSAGVILYEAVRQRQ